MMYPKSQHGCQLKVKYTWDMLNLEIKTPQIILIYGMHPFSVGSDNANDGKIKIQFDVLQFMDEVEEIKKKAEEEEQRKLEAELAAKKKRTFVKKSEEGDKTPA